MEVALAAWLIFGATTAPASQRPLCPPPRADDTYYHVCRAGLRPAVSKVLYDFSVDHFYRPPAPFSRQIDSLMRSLGMDAFFDAEDPQLKPTLENRGSIEFNRLDESSGEFFNKGSDAGTLTVEHEYFGKKYQVALTFPQIIQGLYWRSPIQLELMFYKGHGLRLRLAPPGGEVFEQDLVCISVTPERTLVTTADPDHRQLMVIYEDCQ